MQKEHKEGKMHNEEKRKEQKRKINTRKKRTMKQREGISRYESPSPRTVKQRTHLKKQAAGLPNYPHPQTFAYYTSSIYTTLKKKNSF